MDLTLSGQDLLGPTMEAKRHRAVSGLLCTPDGSYTAWSTPQLNTVQGVDTAGTSAGGIVLLETFLGNMPKNRPAISAVLLSTRGRDRSVWLRLVSIIIIIAITAEHAEVALVVSTKSEPLDTFGLPGFYRRRHFQVIKRWMMVLM